MSTKEKLIELQEDRSLFARMMVVCQCCTVIDLKETVGIYEFAVVLQSVFAPDGSMLQCTAKSTLMAILEKTPLGTCIQSDNPLPAKGPNLTVIIIDGMAELQGLSKPGTVRSCAQLADHFIDTIEQKYGRNAEVRLIFDRYDVAMSLKEATRKKSQRDQDPIYYRITDSTDISKVSMRSFFHTQRLNMNSPSTLQTRPSSEFGDNAKDASLYHLQ